MPRGVAGVLLTVALSVLICGCGTTRRPTASEQYLRTPALVRVQRPFAIQVEDARPRIEREVSALMTNYIYTLDRTDPTVAARTVAADIARLLQRRGIASVAIPLAPGQAPPAGGVVLRLRLTSYYGRLPMATGPMKEMSVEFSAMARGGVLMLDVPAQGKCQIDATLSYDGVSVSLGTSQADATLRASATADIEKEGREVRAAAADEVYVQLLQAIERHFANR